MRPGRSRPARRASFTMVELLVVMAIISILAGLTMAGIFQYREEGERTAVKHTITMLEASIGMYNSAWGDYPPTSLDLVIGKKTKNEFNEGNETLFACLAARKHGGPFADDLEDEHWQNVDNDKLGAAYLKAVKEKLRWTRTGDKLIEYADLWGNPYVYIHNRDYGKTFKYVGVESIPIEVKAVKNATTGEYASPTSYQIWSFGPDGKNDQGDGDDICSWKAP